MATKRKPTASSRANMNFQSRAPEMSRSDSKGTRPTAPPTTIKEVLTMMVLHVCKKSIFFDTNIKVAIYLAGLFLVSLIGDFIPYPKTYLARSDNLFNQYFVKLGWFWTLLFSTPYLLITSIILCCGDRQRVLKHHLPRILIATANWFVWTKMFNIVEAGFGRCNVRGFESKSGCLKAGHFWKGLDISGHAFILIYSSLVLIEEARSIVGWETIREHLRNEEHNRKTADTSQTGNPLKNLSDEELSTLNRLYTRFTPLVWLLFVAMTLLQLLWDVMLVGTMLYYHRMIEKVISGILAIIVWFVTYRTWYPAGIVPPDLPGKGLFSYQPGAKLTEPRRRNPSITRMTNPQNAPPSPRFMGSPINRGQGVIGGGGGDSVSSRY